MHNANVTAVRCRYPQLGSDKIFRHVVDYPGAFERLMGFEIEQQPGYMGASTPDPEERFSRRFSLSLFSLRGEGKPLGPA